MGKRARQVLKGDLGPVLQRWVTSAILPVSARVQLLCEAPGRAEELLASPVFGLPEVHTSRDMLPVYRWALKPGNADDLVLAVLGTAISTCAVSDRPIPLTGLLGRCGDAARETALGQFITQVQGAKAMLRVRKGGKAAWTQARKLDNIAALLGGQVRSALGDDPEVPIRGREVVKIITPTGEDRQISLRRPEEGDWGLLEVARTVIGEKDPHKTTWMSFAMIVLCAAQAEAGWFDLAKVSPVATIRRGPTRKASHGLVLSDSAYGAIKADLDKWMGMGFTYEPMLVPPVEGDYLSVKHRPVAGGRGPMGLKTNARSSAAWHVASEVMAGTAWSVPEGTLKALRDSEFVRGLVKTKGQPMPEPQRDAILGAYRRLAKEEFYLPIFMDFRGRVYNRPNQVTYQGVDLQKALMVFPQASRYTRSDEPSSSHIRATVMHAAACYEGPQKLDKGTWDERWDWWNTREVGLAIVQALEGDWEGGALVDLLSVAHDPLQLLTCLTLQAPGQGDRLACQIDGTCNGLQHLSALFRDETAAPYVNLSASTLGERPRDIYAEVATRVSDRLAASGDPWALRLRHGIRVDRKLCKKPVMVLPYGGTRGTIEDACLEAILEQVPHPAPWLRGAMPYHLDGEPGQMADWLEGSYGAFSERELKDHPLLHLDAKRLGGLVFDCISEVLPKAMLAMQTFRDIAKHVGDRTLEWDTGFNSIGHDSLWVTQAKAKADATSLAFKGLHLPGSIRGLKLRQGRDEIDPRAHTSGIVANFIHSQDAAHLARTMGNFQMMGGRGFGAIHDCFMARPSQMQILKTATRSAFYVQYLGDPLSRAVMLHEPNGKTSVGYGSWYELAAACGTSFPEDGKWDPSEVNMSAWFFS
ncbi:MAG: DNA-directed RNA polymerase [Moraxellaceae bacterium]